MNARLLSAPEMDSVDTTTPTILVPCVTPIGVVTFSIHQVEGEFVIASAPFEVMGPYEAYGSVRAAQERIRSVLGDLAQERLPEPARDAA